MGSRKHKRSQRKRAQVAAQVLEPTPLVPSPADDATLLAPGEVIPPAAGRSFVGTSRSADAAPRGLARHQVQQRLSDRILLDLPVDEEQSGPARCGVVQDLQPHTVAATYPLRTPPEGGPWELAVRFQGLLTQADHQPGPHPDRFDRTERELLVASGQQVALTARVRDVQPGLWRVVARGHLRSQVKGSTRRVDLPRRVIQTHSRFGLLAHGPGVRLWTWPTLVVLGALVALLVQFTLVRGAGYDALAVLRVSLLGCLLGLAGGRLWCLVFQRRPLSEFLTAGASIQGFLLVSLSVVALGSVVLGVPVGRVLDLTTPGIFFGIAVARPGCFLTGCCAGQPTTSRLGLVASDRRIMLRRYPVQLLEGLAGLTLGVVSLVLVWLADPAIDGAIFLAAVATYILERQLLFRLRVESHSPQGRLATTVGAGAVLLIAVFFLFGW